MPRSWKICFCDRVIWCNQLADTLNQIVPDIRDFVPAEPFLQDAALRRDRLDAQFLN